MLSITIINNVIIPHSGRSAPLLLPLRLSRPSAGTQNGFVGEECEGNERQSCAEVEYVKGLAVQNTQD
jgi:hypothetical protein